MGDASTSNAGKQSSRLNIHKITNTGNNVIIRQTWIPSLTTDTQIWH